MPVVGKEAVWLVIPHFFIAMEKPRIVAIKDDRFVATTCVAVQGKKPSLTPKTKKAGNQDK